MVWLANDWKHYFAGPDTDALQVHNTTYDIIIMCLLYHRVQYDLHIYTY